MVKDCELKFIQGSGKAVASFSIAVNEGWGDKKKTHFINCVAWNKTAEALANYTQKGSKIMLSGRINTRNYDNKEGKKVYITEIIADEIEFLSKKEQGQSNSQQDYVDVSDDLNEIPF